MFDDDLDEDFPLGDGTADSGTVVDCPCCGESVEMALDAGGGTLQEYIEDCPVCCQPWRVRVHYDGHGHARVQLSALDE